MRVGLGLLYSGALLIAGCGSSGGGGPPPQFLPPALRGQSTLAMAATYRLNSSSASGGYTVLRDLGDPGGSTWINTSPSGD